MSGVSFKTLSKIAGPLMFVEGVENAAYGEMVEIKLQNGERRQGQVLDTRQGLAIVQVFGATLGLNIGDTSVKFLGETAQLAVSDEMLGRVFDGLGNPRDNGPKIVSKLKLTWLVLVLTHIQEKNHLNSFRLVCLTSME